MQRNLITAVVTVIACSIMTHAGSVSGVVRAGSPGSSIVYLESANASPQPVAVTSKPYIMSQQRMKFTPRILAVPVGATVVFKNEDSPAHNVFWPSVGGDKKLAHNLGTFLSGQQRSYQFDHPGIAPLLCNVHPEMEGFIIVSSTPYYAESDEVLGLYKMGNVPDGQYKAIAWHAGKKIASKIISVHGDATVDFDLTH